MTHQSALLVGCPDDLATRVSRALGDVASRAQDTTPAAMMSADVVLFGPDVSCPIARTQELFRRRKDALVVIACAAADEPAVAEAMRFSPFVGITTRSITSDDPDAVVRQLREALYVASARGRHRSTIRSANQALLTEEPARLSSAARTVRRLEALKAATLQAAFDAIVTVDHRGMILEFNPAAEALFGISAAAATGRDAIEALTTPDVREQLSRVLSRYVAARRAPRVPRRIESRARRRDGTVFPVEFSVVRIPGSDPPLLTAFVRDISERIAAREAAVMRARAEAMEAVAEERRRSAEELERANRDLEAFSYSVAHDLRAPLRTIEGFSSILLTETGNIDTEARDYLGRIHRGAKKMSHLIDALLHLARITRTPMAATPVDLAPLARETLAELQVSESGRKVTASVTEPLMALADPNLASVVLENLLGNAWKFTRTRAEATIMLSAERHGDTTVFCVRDNGVGFDMAYARNLFSPFRRMHRDDEFEGTGIGLATVERILSRHGGHIWAEAAVDGGAAFYFTFGRGPGTEH